MTMKKSKTLQHIAAVAVVLLTLCLVFMMPAAAEYTTITSVADLQGFAADVNGGNTYSGKTVTLKTDLDLSGISWTPIGTGTRSGSTVSGNVFSGTFDGDDHTISNLKITTGTDLGLFGIVSGGTVKNLVLSDVSIQTTTSDSAGAAIGVMANNAKAENIHVSGTVSGYAGVGGVVGRMLATGTISDCINTAIVSQSGKQDAAGGIVGKAYYTVTTGIMTISNCINTGDVTSATYAAGGIAGFSAANVNGCMNTGDITGGAQAGGIVGEQLRYGTISGNSNTGTIKNTNGVPGLNVDGTTDSDTIGTAYGGIVGWIRYNEADNNYMSTQPISVSGNTNSGDVLAPGCSLGAGGIVGTMYNNGTVTNNINLASNIQGGTFAAGILGTAQSAPGNKFLDTLGIKVTENYATTGLNQISVSRSECKSEFCYNNDVTNTDFTVQNNYNTLTAIELTANTVVGGSMEITPNAPYYKGQIVTITVSSDVTHEFASLEVIGTNSVKVGDKYLFMMPAEKVTVTPTFTAKPVVAKIEDISYSSLAEAVADVPTNGDDATTITLLADTKDSFDVGKSTGNPFKNINLDLNGHTLTLGPGVGSQGTETQGIRVLYQSTLTITNGIIQCSNVVDDNVKVGIANYATLTLDDVTVNSGDLVGWTINNRGILTLSGETTVENGKVSPYWAITNDPYDAYYTNQNAILNIADEDVTVGTVSVELYGNAKNEGTVELNIAKGSIGKVIDDGATARTPVKSITGGTYAELMDSKFIKEGYKAILQGGKYVVGAEDAFVPSISATDVGFDSVKVGYTQPTAKTVTLKNEGAIDLTLNKIESNNFIIGNPSEDGKLVYGGADVTFTIQPKENLPVGNYEETIKVTTAEGAETSFKVSFLVYQPSSGGSSTTKPEEPVEPEIPVEPETPTEEPEAGEPSVETEVTDGGEVLFEAPVEPETPGADIPSDEPAEPIVTGVELPEGTDSEVAFIPVSEKPAPAGKETQTKKVFEINVPKYEKGKPATVKFTMTVAELAADGKTAADVALWHQDEETGEWTKLVTTFVIIDGVVYFEAITFDFSPFAIVYEDVSAPTEPETPEQPTESPAPILAVLAGLGAAVVLRRK